jgi:glutamate dehydrogenase
LARDAALLMPFTTALDIADLARASGWPVRSAVLLHGEIGAQFNLDALRAVANSLTLTEHWDRLVVRRASEDFYADQLKLAEAAAKAIGAPPRGADAAWADAVVRDWIISLGAPAQRARAAFDELDAQGQWSFAKLMIAAAEMSALASSMR